METKLSDLIIEKPTRIERWRYKNTQDKNPVAFVLSNLLEKQRTRARTIGAERLLLFDDDTERRDSIFTVVMVYIRDPDNVSRAYNNSPDFSSLKLVCG